MRRLSIAAFSTAVMVGLMALIAPAAAHHSGAMFDAARKVDVTP